MQRSEETIIETGDVRVRILSLEPNEAVPWHFHGNVADNIFCLAGAVAVCLRDPDEQLMLKPGQRCEVQPGRVHRVANPGGPVAKYLLVQGVGAYDFNLAV